MDPLKHQLFVDDGIIESTTRLTRKYHEPAYIYGPVLRAEHPWEGTGVCTFGSVIRDGESGRFRMWYLGWRAGTAPNAGLVREFLFWKTLDKAAEFDIPVALHSGIWGDFRKTDPKHIIPWTHRCRNTHFDLFHLGAPFTRDSLIIAKNEPNVFLNLCWTYVISQKVMRPAIDELIDLVPLNKITGFGADYVCSIQKTYGHLVMARQTLAQIFAGRIAEGDFSEDRALQILERWLYHNPKRIYKI